MTKSAASSRATKRGERRLIEAVDNAARVQRNDDNLTAGRAL